MADCTIISYKGVKIVYTDISGTFGDAAIPIFQKSQLVARQFADGTMLSLVDVTNARYNSNLLSYIKETVKINNPKVKATAVCGLTPLTTLIVNSVILFTGRKMKLVDTPQEAKEWLYQVEYKRIESPVSMV